MNPIVRNPSTQASVELNVEKPYVIPATSKMTNMVLWASAIFGFLFAVRLRLDSTDSVADPVVVILGQLMFGGIGVVSLAGAVRSFLRRNQCWLIDDDSIRFQAGGRVIWRCAWEDFGGWRLPKMTLVERLNSQAWFEILRKSGHVVGRIELRGDVPCVDFVKRELERNTPAGGENPAKFQEWKPGPRNTEKRYRTDVRVGLILALAGLVAMRFYLSLAIQPEVTSPAGIWLLARPWTSLLVVVPLGVGSILAATGGIGLLRLRVPWALSNDPGKMPDFGPSLKDFKLDRNPPVELGNGKCYVYVDPVAQQRTLQTDRFMLVSLRWLTFSFFPIMAAAPVPKIEGPADLWGMISLVAIPIAAIASFWAIERRIALREELVFDRLSIDDERLVVCRGDKEWEYRWPPTRRGGYGIGFLGRWVEVGTDERYRLDPRYLIEAPTAADLEEMRAAVKSSSC